MADVVAIGEILVEIMATRTGQTFREPGLLTGPYPERRARDLRRPGGARRRLDGDGGLRRRGRLRHAEHRAAGAQRGGRAGDPARGGATTGIAFVTYREDGGRDFIFTVASSAAAHLGPEQLEPGLFAGCRYFHVMGSSLFNASVAAAVRRGVELAKAAGAKVSFDPNVRKELLALPGVEETIAAVLAVSDLVLPSEADLAHLFPGRSEDEAAQALLDAGRSMVLLKRGAAGCVYYGAEGRIEVPAFPVEEVDPTGAGDCFGGTFVACLTLGVPVPAGAPLWRTRPGRWRSARRGRWRATPTVAELEAFLAARGVAP